jgi:carbon-monoxide dehydrogenase small subunit
MTPLVTIQVTVNGRRRRLRVPPMKRLLDVLREDAGLTGTKEGCGEGECGACSVLMDGHSVCSCLVPAVQADGARVVTVEGLAPGRRLTALQQAFLDLGGAQCGICTPGMLVTSMELLRRTRGRVPTEDEVRAALAGNLCRCTGYQKIVDAVRAASKSTRSRSRRLPSRLPGPRPAGRVAAPGAGSRSAPAARAAGRERPREPLSASARARSGQPVRGPRSGGRGR